MDRQLPYPNNIALLNFQTLVSIKKNILDNTIKWLLLF